MADVAAVGLTSLRKSFGSGGGAVHAVDDVTLSIKDGEFFSLLGPSGSGKTTLLRLIAGFERPTSGAVSLGGQDVTRLPPFRRDVNTVFQDYALFPHLSVIENVEYGLRAKKVPGTEARRRAAAALGTVQLADLAGRAPAQLSGGQRQRVALARALVNRPRVLLLDEPLGALDLKLREQMQTELKAIQREAGITFVVVTHDQVEALTMSDRIAVLDGGRIRQVGTPSEVYERPATAFVAGFVGISNLVVGGSLMGQEGTFSIRPEKIELYVLDEHEGPPPAPGGDHVAADGTVREVAYAGPTTRYVVALDAGPELTVLTPNSATSQGEAIGRRGRAVRLTWARRHAVRMPEERDDETSD